MQRKILEEIISKQSERKSIAYVINTKNGDEFIISRDENCLLYTSDAADE